MARYAANATRGGLTTSSGIRTRSPTRSSRTDSVGETGKHRDATAREPISVLAREEAAATKLEDL